MSAIIECEECGINFQSDGTNKHCQACTAELAKPPKPKSRNILRIVIYTVLVIWMIPIMVFFLKFLFPLINAQLHGNPN